MPLNRDDFIFHSDYLPFGVVDNRPLSLTISGSVPANNLSTRRIIYGSWVETGQESIMADMIYKYPPSPYLGWPGEWSYNKNGFTYPHGTQGGGNVQGLYFRPFVQVQGSRYRIGVSMFNNRTYAITAPTATLETIVTVYHVPPN